MGASSMRTVVAVAIVLSASSAAVRAQQISCGDVPKIQRSVEEKLKADVQGKAQLFTKLLGNADVQGAVERSKTELYQEHQDVGKDEIDLYFAWVSCQTIVSDQNLSSTDKVNQWMAIYKMLLGRGPAGPTTTAAKPGKKPSVDASVFFIDGLKFSVKKLLPPKNSQVAMILSILNINDNATRLVLLQPFPTLTDDEGNAGHFTGSEGIQYCNGSIAPCAKQTEAFFTVQPNFPVNAVLRFNWPSGGGKPSTASFSSRVLITNSDKGSEPTAISLAFPDIPFSEK